MEYILIVLWVLSAVPILLEQQKVLRMVIYLGIFSLMTASIYLVLGAPDVALAEASIGIFSTIFLIVCFEKYYKIRGDSVKKIKWFKYLLPAGFTILAAAMFIWFAPVGIFNYYAMTLYISNFAQDIGGQNAVGAILLGYRLYDTIFEALMLTVAAVAVSHLSYHKQTVATRQSRPLELSNKTNYIVRMVSPLFLVFGIYLIGFGHISAGGGFQGGVAIAAFAVCRFMTFRISDLPTERFIRAEKFVFLSIVMIAVLISFGELRDRIILDTPLLQHAYLIAMNSLIGMKVALCFMMLFYRFIAIERS